MSTPHRRDALARGTTLGAVVPRRSVEGRCYSKRTARDPVAAQPQTVNADWELPPVTKRTFQPNNRRRHKTHGFRLRMRTRAGRAIVGARRRKGRARLAA